MSRLLDNLSLVRERIAAAARRSGRRADDITLVAVTKYVSDGVIEQLVQAGCHDLGESRPQALKAKALALNAAPAARWHLIGHLQRNKVEAILPLVSLIHSADSLRLLQALEQVAAKQNRSVPVLLEVNVSGDASKHGFTPEEVAPQLPMIAALGHVAVRGLMCMAARERDERVSRANFAGLRTLRDQLLPERPENVSLEELSMGMSGDFEIAIEEGATIVRIGSALFEGIEP